MGYIMELRKLVGTRPLIMVGACVLLCDHQRLLLQRRTDNGLWGLARGSLEPGESLEDVAKRELFELAGRIMGIPVLDHVIIGENSFASLRESKAI